MSFCRGHQSLSTGMTDNFLKTHPIHHKRSKGKSFDFAWCAESVCPSIHSYAILPSVRPSLSFMNKSHKKCPERPNEEEFFVGLISVDFFSRCWCCHFELFQLLDDSGLPAEVTRTNKSLKTNRHNCLLVRF